MSMNLYINGIDLYQTQTEVTDAILKVQEEMGYEIARDAYVEWLVTSHGSAKLYSAWSLRNLPNYRGYLISDVIFEHIWKLHCLGTGIRFSVT